MKKKLLLAFFVAMLSVMAFANITASAYTYGDLTYKISNGEVIITDCDESATGEMVIPKAIAGYPVTSIGNSAFSDCTGLTSITIPDSVTSIGNYLFSDCTGLTSVNIPDSVTSIGVAAFAWCQNLTSITIPDSVTSIGNWAFSDCTRLTSITIPDSVTSIGNYLFSDCTGLTSVNIPDSVTSIGDSAFSNCTGLTSITIPDRVTSIGGYVFYNCTGLTSINIGNSVISIGDGAFEECTGLTSITIPDSVISIGKNSFSCCAGLTSITIPDSVTSIGDQAFAWCQNLTSISVNKENIDYCSQDGVLFSKSKAKIICYPQGKKDTSYTIPGSVTFIGDWAFNYCTGLTKITIPDSVTSIGDWAFNYCTGLTRINIPDSVTSIGDWAFKNCTGLTSITIPDRVTSIGGYVFYNCTGLTSINIGNSVISIGDGAFSNCTGLTSVTIPDSVTTIGESAFLSCTGLTNINIGNSVTSIGNSTFSQCTGLTSINIGNSVTSIGKYAFSDCTGLTSITIGNSVTSIGSYAFSDCTGLTSVIIGDSVTSIGSRAFCWCIRLTSITIPDSVTSIGKEAFSNCKSLTDVYYSGSEEDWNAIKISDYYNDSLLDATIHYNCKPETDEDDDVTDDEPLPNTTRQISAEFIGGQDIVYNADSNSYNKESFTLIGTLENLWQWDDWDREDYSVHNVKVELTLPDGFSFEEASSVQSKTVHFEEIVGIDSISETIYLSNPPVGSSKLSVRITGDNMEEINVEHYFYVDKTEFQIDIYRANYLINSDLGNVMENTYININETPCNKLYAAGQGNWLDTSVEAWDTIMNLLDTVDNPANITDYAFEEKDMYEAIIMSLFENSVDYKVMGYINSEITKQTKDLFSQITSQMKNKYNFDMLYGTNLKKLNDKQRQEVADDLVEYFEFNYQNAAIVSKGVGFISEALKYATDFQSLCERISAYYNVMCMSDSMKQVMQYMYNECPSNNLALKQALKDCISVMDSSDDEFTQKMLGNLIAMTGMNVAQAGINEFWDSVKTTFEVANPGAFAFKAAYEAGKYITDVGFNSDTIAEKYCNIIALMDVENLMSSIYSKAKLNFQLNGTQSNAQLYNSIVDVMFNMLDTDYNYAIAYTDAIDSALLGKIAIAFGDSSTEEFKKGIRWSQDSTRQFHGEVLTNWIFQLEKENINKFNEYKHLIDETHENYRKKYEINCPVDVYVFDKNGVIVGSVVNNVPYCKAGANITIGVTGDRKTIYMHGEEYDIVYKGNDIGTMDITVTEYDESRADTRKVYFNDLDLATGLTYTSSESGTNSTENVYALLNESDESITPDFDSLMDADSETYTAQVTRGYFTNTMAVSQEVHVGENVNITAYIPNGYKFVNWTSDAECNIFDDANSVTTKITMPEYDVNITATITVAVTPGDLNSDSTVDVRDVIALRRFIAGGYGINADENVADINKDGGRDVRDVIMLRRFIAGGYGVELK